DRMDPIDPGDVLDADDALMHRLVRQPGRAGEIADRIDSVLAGARPFVGDDVPALDPDLGAFEAELLDIPGDADRRDDLLDRDLDALPAKLDRGRDPVLALLERFYGRTGMDLDTLLFEGLAGENGNFLVLDRQYPVKHLDDRHLGAHVAVEAGELDADRAGADHQQRFRHRLRHHRLLVGPDLLAVGLDAGERARPSASREDDVLGGEIGDRLAVLGDGDLAFARQFSVAVEHGDLVLAQEETDAVRELLGDGARAGDDLAGIEADLLGRKPVIAEPVQQVVDFRGAQERLGRDAAPVEADAAEMLALHDRGFHAELRCADRRDIAARSAAEHDDI